MEFKLLEVCLGTLSFNTKRQHIQLKFAYFHVAINLLRVIHTLICTNTHYEYASGNMLLMTNARNTSDRQCDKVNLPLRDI